MSRRPSAEHPVHPAVALLVGVAVASGGAAAQDETAAGSRAGAGDPMRPDGIEPRIERAIESGLDWLVRRQTDDGSWREPGNYGAYPVAMTALAGMALLGHGSTPTRGRYYREVRRATDFLLDSARPSGLITSPWDESRSMYGHGFATMFLAQVFGMEEDVARQRRIRSVLVAAIDLTARAQSRHGGWLYTPDASGDEGSVTVTQIQALRACRNAGLTVPRETIEQAVDYIRKSSNRDGSIRYSIGSSGGGRPPITAAAVAVLYNAGAYDDPLAERALAYARRTLPVTTPNGHYFYAHLYLAQALYQRGGDDWHAYYPRIADHLLERQFGDGHWKGDGVGTIYGTALALTVLQLPYARVPIYMR